MTTIDRFDPFEQRITAAIDEIAAPRRPDYLADVLAQTARTPQRPRWQFLLPLGPRPIASRQRHRLPLVVLLGLLSVGVVAAVMLAAGSRLQPSRLVLGVFFQAGARCLRTAGAGGGSRWNPDLAPAGRPDLRVQDVRRWVRRPRWRR